MGLTVVVDDETDVDVEMEVEMKRGDVCELADEEDALSEVDVGWERVASIYS